jgi:hypothetical protein
VNAGTASREWRHSYVWACTGHYEEKCATVLRVISRGEVVSLSFYITHSIHQC